MSAFARRALFDRADNRTTRAIARAVAVELLPELERLLERSPAQVVPSVPRPFERGCIDADLHVSGSLCSSCGGSFF